MTGQSYSICPCNWPPIKTLDTQVQGELSGLATLHKWVGNPSQLLSHIIVGGNSPVTLLSKDTWKFVHGVLQISPHAPFPYADFILYLFAIISHNHEYNHFWVLWIFPANHWAWGWSWKALTQDILQPHNFKSHWQLSDVYLLPWSIQTFMNSCLFYSPIYFWFA